jgi:hypothetical protein
MDSTAEPPRAEVRSSLFNTRPLVALTSPIIYSLIVPFALADLWVSLYQTLCFPVYRMRPVERAAFFKLDRAKLPYLNAIEKLNCLYCSYVNGVIGYVREVAARTEQYWCPIKHAEDPHTTHDRYTGFAAYGEAADLSARREELRAALGEAQCGSKPSAAPPTITPAVRPAR